LKKLVGSDYEHFEKNLFGISGGPEAAADSLTFSGCRQHLCAVEAAAVHVSTTTGVLVAAILSDNRIRVYSDEIRRIEDIPAGLHTWAQEAANNAASEVTVEFRTPNAAAR
jgi:hypothetical protein